MAVSIKAKVHISDKLKEAMRQSPRIVVEELGEGMQKVSAIRDRVKANITTAGLIERGRLLRGVKAVVIKRPGQGSVTGIVRSGARHAGIHEHGGTIKAKKPGGYLMFPIGQRVEITHVGGRKLKRSRMETIGEKWVRVKQVEIKAKWPFRRGVKDGMPTVETSLEKSAHKALLRIFEPDGSVK